MMKINVILTRNHTSLFSENDASLFSESATSLIAENDAYLFSGNNFSNGLIKSNRIYCYIIIQTFKSKK